MKVFAPCFSLIFGFLIFVSLTVLHAQDITIDDEGDDAGNIELRIKYAYVQYKIPDYLIFTGSHLKFGITQRPWIDFKSTSMLTANSRYLVLKSIQFYLLFLSLWLVFSLSILTENVVVRKEVKNPKPPLLMLPFTLAGGPLNNGFLSPTSSCKEAI
ncbi:hypothetical protein MNBD_BACTEROID07-356 [hydrothermal vent metagenome]|uniref:Uncharacterized protein n=1 Tax=hydrothermal vent metagenome TaxID=652676 RepID=A0A3B0UD42_9ZZZZ